MQKVLCLLMGGILMVFLFSCQNNIDLPTENPNSNPSFPSTSVQASVSGLVKDQMGNFVADADVIWGNAMSTTDENGYFKITSTVQAKKAVLTVQKSGYFKSIQTLQAFENQTVSTKIQLIDRQVSGTVSAMSGGEISTSIGAKIDFSAASFQDNNGNSYTGEVNVYTYYLDPTVDNLTEVMPGNLTALNVENVPQILQSFGMLNVELEGSSGQSLQINQPATMTMPVPNSLQNNAPATIPLWYFDETTGLWMEEGTATLQGDVYVGEVAHFTWWNCDIPQDFVFLSGNIEAGEFVPVVEIRVTDLNTGFFGIMYSSTDGTFGGFVPKDATLLFEILDNCDEILHTQQINPLMEDTDLGTISVSLTVGDFSVISGNVQNCTQMPVQNGYVLVTAVDADLSFVFEVDDNGDFSGIVEHCTVSALLIQATDIDNLIQSETIEITPNATVDVGILSACEQEIESSLILSYDNEQVVMTSCFYYDDFVSGVENAHFFSANHATTGGNVNYLFLVYTDTLNGANNVVFADFEIDISGNPSPVYSFTSSDVEIISVPANSGDFFEFSIQNVTVNETNAGTLSETGTIVGKAKLQ